MILADKIIHHRKKNGWSQEELAEKVHVSRQSVSKWESAQSVPDLEKILLLANLFGVTTDYLLKDELEDAEYTDAAPADPALRRVTLAEANEYLALRADAAKRIALGVLLCILSPVCLLLLCGLSECPGAPVSETLAGVAGIIILLVTVAVAVAIFILTGARSAHFEFLEKEPFETEYGVTGMVRERRAAFRDAYTRSNLIGVILCILSPVPLIAAAFTGSDLFILAMLCVMLVTVSIAVSLFIRVGVRWESMQKLLQEGEYTVAQKKRQNRYGDLYWSVALAVYLLWSFLSGDWHITWIVWPVAAVLFGVLAAVLPTGDDKD